MKTRVGPLAGPTFFLALLACVLACASGAQRQDVSPAVTITQTSTVRPIEAAANTLVPAEYRLDMTNPFDYPLRLTAVEVETVGLAGGYTMRRVRHTFDRTIPAHGTDAIDFRAWVQPLQVTDRGDIVTSVILRGVAHFDAGGKVVKTAFTGRADQRGSD